MRPRERRARCRSGSPSSRGRRPRARRRQHARLRDDRRRPGARLQARACRCWPTSARSCGSGACTGTRGCRRRASPASAFDYSGLRRLRGGQLVDAPALTRLPRAARRLEGCAKRRGRRRAAAADTTLRCGIPSAAWGPRRLRRGPGGASRSGGCSPPRWPGGWRSPMLPLGFVLFAAAETDSTATAGRAGRRVLGGERARARARAHRGPPRAARAGGVRARLLVPASPRSRWPARRTRPPRVLVILGGLAGLVVPPLGPFTRAVWGSALRDRGELQRVYRAGLGGRGGGGLIVAPLVVALLVVVASPGRRSGWPRRACWPGARSRPAAR